MGRALVSRRRRRPAARALDLRDAEATWSALAREALDGDVEATRRLFDALAPVVRRVCHGVLGYRHLDLEDTIQESLVDVLRALPQYRSEGHLVHYVTKIAIRRAILTRREARRARPLQGLGSAQAATRSSRPVGPVAEQARMVSEVIARSARYRAEDADPAGGRGFLVDEVAAITSVPDQHREGRAAAGEERAPPHRRRARSRELMKAGDIPRIDPSRGSGDLAPAERVELETISRHAPPVHLHLTLATRFQRGAGGASARSSHPPGCREAR